MFKLQDRVSWSPTWDEFLLYNTVNMAEHYYKETQPALEVEAQGV